MPGKQISIPDMLKQKRAEKAVETDVKSNRISPYLLNSNDITEMSNYTVSIMARVYFREHSNINDILDRYVERQKIEECNKEDYLVTLIRHVTSDYRIRRDYPFNMFKFESDYHECIGKFLLKNYEIKSNEDLKEADSYVLANNLKHCQISMDISNKFRTDEQVYINRKIKKVGYQNLKPFMRLGSDHALRQYNQEHNLFVKFNINDITLEKMCQISTIERMARNDLAKRGFPESAYNNCLNSIFIALKSNKGLAITQQGFYVFPQYLLIINNLTIEQERAVTERMDLFYSCTNAKELLAMYKKNIAVKDENADPVTNRKERRKIFYLKFIRMVDKKMPPFHNLLWIKEDYIISQSHQNNQQYECEAGPSNASVWKKKTLAKKNETAQQPKKNSEINRDEENTVIEHRLARNPKDYFSAQKSGSRFAEIILFLMKENELIEELKKEIVKDKICAKMWDKNFKVILWNCMHYNLDDRNEHFMYLLKKCSCSNREQLNEMLKKVGIDVNVVQNIPVDFVPGDPVASSTQNMDIQFDPGLLPINDNHQNRPFQSCNNSDDIEDIVDINNKPLSECEIEKTIKQEKLSEQFVDNSDVQIVSLNATEVISISDEENTTLEVNRIIPENIGIDVYQQNLNIESQVNTDSHDINASMEAEYGLNFHRFAMENITNRRNAQHNKPSTMNYESDSTSQNSNGNRTIDDFNIPQESNNFSIFFSTQLMFDYAYHSTLANQMTYAKAPKSSVSSSNQNNYRPCFVLEAQRITYLKNHKFEMFINLPLLSLYDIHIRNSFIKEVLNLSDLEWNILLCNLNLLENYEFIRKKSGQNRSKKEDEFENVVKKHLDLYFSSLSSFKKFHYRPSDDLNHHIEGFNSNLIINSKNVTKSIKPSILQKIKLLKK